MADSKNFIEQIIDEELKEGGRVYGKKIHTRFPPEPNGYLHIGHAKALEIDFGTAEAYNGLCNLRMDDTNPTKEDEEYVEAIKEDIHWLGHDWDDRFFYASDYFEKMYEVVNHIVSNHPDHPLSPYLIGQCKLIFKPSESIGLIEKLS